MGRNVNRLMVAVVVVLWIIVEMICRILVNNGEMMIIWGTATTLRCWRGS
jgi:hypothetical protein